MTNEHLRERKATRRGTVMPGRFFGGGRGGDGVGADRFLRSAKFSAFSCASSSKPGQHLRLPLRSNWSDF